MDEAAMVHENITVILGKKAWVPTFRGGHGVWIMVYSLIAIALSGMGSRTILSFFKGYPRQAIIMVSGAVIFLTGAVGLEIVGYQLRGTGHPMLYNAEIALEELFEMSGASIIFFGTILCAIRKV